MHMEGSRERRGFILCVCGIAHADGVCVFVPIVGGNSRQELNLDLLYCVRAEWRV